MEKITDFFGSMVFDDRIMKLHLIYPLPMQ